MVQVRETVAHLFSLGRFEGVSVDAALEEGRVALRYDLVPIHPVSRIRFAGPLGVPGIDEGALRRAVFDRYGASPPLSRVADMTRILADALRERGYLHASIAPHAEVEHDPERATLVFTIDPGARTHIGTVEVAGTARRARRGSRSARPVARRAVPARGARRAHRALHRGTPQARLLRGEDRPGRSPRRAGAGRGPDADGHAGAARARGVHRRSAALGPARRAGPGRARRLGRRGSARGLEQPHRRVPARAGLSRCRRRRIRARSPTASW